MQLGKMRLYHYCWKRGSDYFFDEVFALIAKIDNHYYSLFTTALSFLV